MLIKLAIGHNINYIFSSKWLGVKNFQIPPLLRVDPPAYRHPPYQGGQGGSNPPYQVGLFHLN
ncbi:MAG: hypothetical protein EWV58_01580 [Microcystis aeruginosa Ma_MB_F_20061100_S19]|nr:MAG: hypothetical protein EWV59_15355 [Microcystis aeruginosa Ma_MB_F_20061100_S19D]TRU18579.1 MAG: hypothetical protein EWV58_01580 [Microcystis aeruginosa Ma_MB_F_20061100_S19]